MYTKMCLAHVYAYAMFGSTFPVAAYSDSGLVVTKTATGGCTISGSVVTMTSGTTACTVNFNQAGNANYNAAPLVSSIVAASKKALSPQLN